MKHRQGILAALLLFAQVLYLASCSNCHVPEVSVRISPCSPIPTGLASAAACSCNGRGYIFGGRNAAGVPQNGLWEYNPASDNWTPITTFSGKARVKPVIMSDDSVLYMGLGFSGEKVYVDSCYLRDWWRFSPKTKQWKRLADFPTKNCNAAVAYHVNNRIYVIYGAGEGFSRDVQYYDITTDSWTVLEDDSHRALSGFGGCGTKCQGRYYYGMGFNTSNLKNWYEVNLPSDNWTKCSSLPGKGRELSACCAAGEYVYVFGGRYFGGEYTGGEVFESFLRYHITDDQWEYCGSMPYGRAENAIAFTIGDKAYFGLGENEDAQVHTNLYCIE